MASASAPDMLEPLHERDAVDCALDGELVDSPRLGDSRSNLSTKAPQNSERSQSTISTSAPSAACPAADVEVSESDEDECVDHSGLSRRSGLARAFTTPMPRLSTEQPGSVTNNSSFPPDRGKSGRQLWSQVRQRQSHGVTWSDGDGTGSSPLPSQKRKSFSLGPAVTALSAFRGLMSSLHSKKQAEDAAEEEVGGLAAQGDGYRGEPSLWRPNGDGCGKAPVVSEVELASGLTQYCIVSHKANVRELYEQVVVGEWDLQPPKLIISIMGGAGHMQMNDSIFDLESFSRGLVRAALRTGGWVITGGTASGVMDLVGKAMKTHDKQREVPCIGVLPFGALKRRWREAVDNEDGCSEWQASLLASDDERDNGIPLASVQENHTHVFMIDSGKIGGKAYGTETLFRAEFEQFLGKCQVETRSVTMASPRGSASIGEIPRVMILVNGGKFSLDSVLEAIQHGCPVVVCQGSGRVADTIVTLLKGSTEGRGKLDADECMDAALEHLKPDTANDSDKEKLLTIVRSRRVAVFSLAERLEEVIFRAMFDKSDDSVKGGAENQLILAVQWKCSNKYRDLCRQLVLECSRNSGTDQAALSPEGGYQFSRNMSNNEVAGGYQAAILTIFKRLVSCSSTDAHGEASVQCNRDKIDAGPIVDWLLEHYPLHMDKVEVSEDTLGRIRWDGLGQSKEKWYSMEGLLLWSVEVEAPVSVLKAIWMHMQDPCHAALATASACRQTAVSRHAYGSYTDSLLRKRLEDIADSFEKLAINLLTDLAQTTGLNPVEYIFQESQLWGGYTCFRLAHLLKCKMFVAAEFYRLAIDNYRMTPVPFELDKPQLNMRYKNPAKLLSVLFWPTGTGLRSRLDFYSTPYVKVYTHGLSRILFIILYSYTVFIGKLADGDPSLHEAMLFIWGCSFAMVEFQQLSSAPSFKEYISDPWNLLDCIHISTLLLTMSISFITADSKAAVNPLEKRLETLHCLNLLPSFFRVLQNFQISEYFGTLIMTVVGMGKDAMYFLVLLGIFALGFSCALTPILFPAGEARSKQGIFWSLWAIFGEVNDDARKAAEDMEWWLARRVAQILLYVLSLVSNVLLVNLLIAVMNNTYEDYQQHSHTEWAFFSASLVFDLDEVQILPPPLNLIETFWRIDDASSAEPVSDDMRDRSFRRMRSERPMLKRSTSKVKRGAINHSDMQQSQAKAAHQSLGDVDASEEEEVVRLRAENEELRGKNADMLAVIEASRLRGRTSILDEFTDAGRSARSSLAEPLFTARG